MFDSCSSNGYCFPQYSFRTNYANEPFGVPFSIHFSLKKDGKTNHEFRRPGQNVIIVTLVTRMTALTVMVLMVIRRSVIVIVLPLVMLMVIVILIVIVIVIVIIVIVIINDSNRNSDRDGDSDSDSASKRLTIRSSICLNGNSNHNHKIIAMVEVWMLILGTMMVKAASRGRNRNGF